MRGWKLVLALVVAVGVVACSADGPLGGGRVSTVTMRFLTPATVKSLIVEVTGPGIGPAVVLNIPVGADTVATGSLTLPSGSARRFVVTAVDTAGVQTHRADTTITLQPGATPNLAMRLTPLASTLGITVTFGSVRLTLPDVSLQTLFAGDSLAVGAYAVLVSGDTVSAASLTWGTSNPAVATVAGGRVRAQRAGFTDITASIGGAAASVKVRVLARVATVNVSPSSATISEGTTLQLVARARDAGGHELPDRPVAWETSDSTVVLVSSSGIVTGVGTGTAVVTASTEGRSGSASLTIIPNPGPAVSLALSTVASGARVGKPFVVQPVVELRDAAGVKAATTTRVVTVTAGPGVTLNGTKAVSTTSGVASFQDLELSGPAGPHQLVFSATDVEDPVSQTVYLGLGQLLISTSNADRSCADCEVSIVDETGALVRYLGTGMFYSDLSADGKRVVYSNAALWGAGLVVKDVSTSLAVTIRNTFTNLRPQWSPNGERIAFHELGVDGSEIFWVTADGSQELRLTTNAVGDVHPSWSADGQSLVWVREQYCQASLLVESVVTSNRQVLPGPGPIDCPWFEFPRFSPDGSRLAVVVHNRDLRIGRADGTEFASVLTALCEIGGLAWSPDGDQLAFSGCTQDGNRDVFIVRYDGTGLRNVTNTPNANEYVSSWR